MVGRRGADTSVTAGGGGQRERPGATAGPRRGPRYGPRWRLRPHPRRGVQDKSTITDYVVTGPLAQNFDKALDLIKSALETGASRAAYLNGSFGSGKSHFMAVLHAILKGDPDARGKKGLADVVSKHDKWLTGRKFLLVPYHLPDSQSLDAAILGGYVAHVATEYNGAPLPAVYRDDNLIADAAQLRQQVGDDKFVDLLPATDAEAHLVAVDRGSAGIASPAVFRVGVRKCPSLPPAMTQAQDVISVEGPRPCSPLTGRALPAGRAR